MQYCPNCGKKIPNGVKFCPFCGYQLVGSEQPNNSQERQNQQSYSQNNQNQNPNFNNRNYQNQAQNFANQTRERANEGYQQARSWSKSNPLTTKIIIGVLAVIVVFFGYNFLFHSYSNELINQSPWYVSSSQDSVTYIDQVQNYINFFKCQIKLEILAAHQ